MLSPEGRPGRFRSHITYEDDTHGPTVSHHPASGQLVPWFSLLLHDLTEEAMRVVPESLNITFPPARTDQMYLEHVKGEGGWRFINALPKPDESCFIQFDVWAGMTEGWRGFDYSSVPYGNEIGLSAPQDQQSRPFQAPFEADRGCVIVMSWVLGELDGPLLLRPSRVTRVAPTT
ncbi:MAG: hypothetical protein V3U47_03180 [Acidimicrobiia bacterium]